MHHPDFVLGGSLLATGAADPRVADIGPCGPLDWLGTAALHPHPVVVATWARHQGYADDTLADAWSYPCRSRAAIGGLGPPTG